MGKNTLERSITISTSRLKYYLATAEFWFYASELQIQRCLCSKTDAKTSRIDLGFYVVSVQRLREVSRMMNSKAKLSEAKTALELFDSEWPKIKELRNNEEHILGPWGNYPKGVWYFNDLVAELHDGGKVVPILRIHETQNSVTKLFNSLKNILEEKIGTS